MNQNRAPSRSPNLPQALPGDHPNGLLSCAVAVCVAVLLALYQVVKTIFVKVGPLVLQARLGLGLGLGFGLGLRLGLGLGLGLGLWLGLGPGLGLRLGIGIGLGLGSAHSY